MLRSLGLAAAVAGVFGMNLVSGCEDVPYLLWGVAGGTIVLSGALLQLLTGGIRRFHRASAVNVMATAELRKVLGGLDHAYYALRNGGHILADTERAVSKDELQTAMEAAGGVPPGSAIGNLLDLMDRDNDGMLSQEELVAWVPEDTPKSMHVAPSLASQPDAEAHGVSPVWRRTERVKDP